MYLEFFGLQRLPFRLRPDPEFLYLDEPGRQARSDLIEALKHEQPVVALSGPTGVGKTTLLASVVQELAAGRTVLQINQPQLSIEDLVVVLKESLMAALGSEAAKDAAAGAETSEAVPAPRTLRRSPLLIIENGHLIEQSPLPLGQLFELCEMRIPTLLVGCSETEALPAWAKTDLSIAGSAHIHLLPLGADSIRAYIEHRLTIGGAQDCAIFSEDACHTVYAATGGAPRRINALCDAALSVACTRSLRRVGATEIVAAMHKQHLQSLPSAIATPAPERAMPDPPVPEPRPMASVVSIASPLSARAASEPTMVQIEKALAEESGTAIEGESVSPASEDQHRVAPKPEPLQPETNDRGFSAAPLQSRPVRLQLTVLRGNSTLMSLMLKPGQLTIGRLPDNDIVLQGDYVSRNHCALITALIGEQLRTTLIDLGSSNGVYINRSGTKRQVLCDGDVIRIGEFRLHYTQTPEPAAGTNPDPTRRGAARPRSD